MNLAFQKAFVNIFTVTCLICAFFVSDGAQGQGISLSDTNLREEVIEYNSNAATKQSQNNDLLNETDSLFNSDCIDQEELKELGKEPDICGEIVLDLTRQVMQIDLATALSIALENNFNIKILNARTNKNKWEYYRALSNWLPDIDYLYNLQRINGTFLVGGIVPVEVSETPIESTFGLDLTLSVNKYFTQKERYFNYKSTKEDFNFTVDETLLNTVIDYYALLRNKLGINILKTNIKQIEEQLKINTQRFEAGVGTKFDVLRAEADLAVAEQELIVVKNRFRLSQAKLANTLGLPVFIHLQPSPSDSEVKELFKDCFDLNLAESYAIQCRNDLASRRFDVEATRQKRNNGYSVYVPSVSMIGALSEQGTRSLGLFSSQVLGVLVSWKGGSNLGLDGYTDIKARNAELQEVQLSYINETREVQEKIVEAYYNVIASKELVESTEVALKSAEESRRIAVIRLDEGIGTFIDVLQAQSAYTEARINNLRAVVAYNVAQARLLFEMGVISTNNILYGFDSSSNKQNINK